MREVSFHGVNPLDLQRWQEGSGQCGFTVMDKRSIWGGAAGLRGDFSEVGEQTALIQTSPCPVSVQSI